MKHLVFYDGDCGLCDRFVQFIIAHDNKNQFVFAPLQGITAKKWPEVPKDLDTVVLIENYESNPKVSYRSQAVFRVLNFLGGAWSLIGSLSIFPSFFFDWGYRLVARNRHSLFKPIACVTPKGGKFLP